MEKEKRIISYFLGWLLIGFLICIIGINNVLAEEVAYNSATFRVKECGSDEWSNWTNATQKLSIYSVNRLGLRLYFNNTTLNANTYYNISITYNFYTEAPSINVMNSYGKTTFYYNTTNTESGNIQGNNNNYSVRFEKDTENTNIIKAVYNVLIPVNAKFIAFNINWDEPNKETCRTLSDGFTISDIKVESLNDTQAIVDGNNANTENIINNNNQNTQDIINNQNQNNEELKDTIKDQFNECRESNNIIPFINQDFNLNNIRYYVNKGSLYLSGTSVSETSSVNQKFKDNLSFTLKAGTYYFSHKPAVSTIYLYDMNNNLIKSINKNNVKDTFTLTEDTQVFLGFYQYQVTYSNINTEIMISKSDTSYDPYGEEICSNKIDEQVETSKGIWATIKDLPNVFKNMLKGLFIPDDGYFEEWFNDLKTYFEQKLGFLATPFTIIIDFINRYLELNPNDDIVINIPNITVPNFENHIIIKETTFNWSELLNSKESLNMLWDLYLSFVDVFLILNFIGLCENKYNRIFGGDTTPYEYYTTEDSYMFDTDTGEITKMGVHKEKRTTRKKVN